MNRTFITFFALLILNILNVYSFDFEVNGIYYTMIGGGEVRVTNNSYLGNSYSGNVTIPETIIHYGNNYKVTTIGEQAFYRCTNLLSINIPQSVTTIQDNAFDDCTNLTSVFIPAGVSSIGAHAFSDCYKLEKIDVDPSNLYYQSIDNVIFSKDLKTLVCCAGGKAGSYIIPDGVKEIATGAFGGCILLENITIPQSVETLYPYSFYYCRLLKNIVLPTNIKSIGYSSFESCVSLESIIIPNGVTTITNRMFMGCSNLKYVVIPNSVVTIDNNAFQYCGNIYVNVDFIIGNGLKTIKSGAFESCQINSITCFAETPPTLERTNEFNSKNNTKLYVLSKSKYNYSRANGWKDLTNIYNIPKCSTPTIKIEKGLVKFYCETEGVQFVSSLTASDVYESTQDFVKLSPTYNITVFARKEGWEDSYKYTEKITFDNSKIMEGDIDGDGQLTIKDVTKLIDKILKDSTSPNGQD